MKEKVSLIIKILLGLAVLFTTAYLLMLGWYNTLSLDDYGFAVDMRSHTPFSWMKQMYLTWQGRFSGFFVSGLIFDLFGNGFYLWIWTILHLLLGYVVVWLYMKNVVKIKDMCISIGISILLTNITICSVFEISTFYWLCCAGYFLVIYATLLLIYILFYARRREWVRYIVAILCALYVSGSAENYTPLVLLVLGLVWLYSIIKDTKSSSFGVAFQRHLLLFIVCAILGIGFLVMVLAPGNEVRLNKGGQTAGFMHQFAFVPFVKKVVIANFVFGLRLLSRGLYVLGVFPIAMWLGRWMQEHNVVIDAESIWKRVIFATVSLAIFIFIAVTACVYGIGYYPPLRAMGFVLFVVMAWVLYCGILVGYRYSEQLNKCINCCLLICLCLWIGYGCYYTIKEQPAAKHYYEYIQDRDTQIQQLAATGNTSSVNIPQLTLPYWPNSYSYVRNFVNRCVGSKQVVRENYFPYMTSDLCDNPNDFKNNGLKLYYNADFDLYGYPTEFK